MKQKLHLSLIIVLTALAISPVLGESAGEKKVFINYLAGYAEGSAMDDLI